MDIKMDIKEARRICREVADQNTALMMLADAVDAIESGLAEVHASKMILASLQENMKPLEEKRDKITQETVDLETHYTNLKNDLDTIHKEYILNHEAKMEDLTERSGEEESVLRKKNNKLRGTNSNLENDIIEKEKQLDEIDAILNTRRG